MIMPVSVCHHVSTTGVRSPPMCSRYHTQASGLIGSPTEPSSRSDERLCFSAHSRPHFMCGVSAVGAVYRMSTLFLSMIDHQRPGSGKFGTPSYITPVVPLHSGP